MSGMLSLPTELIAVIVSLLSPFKLRELLRIYNRRLCEIVQIAYSPHRWYVENALRHTNGRFQRPRASDTEISKPSRILPDHLVALNAGISPFDGTERVPRAGLATIGLDADCDGFISINPPYLRGWMRLNGSLDWLLPRRDTNASRPASLPDSGKQYHAEACLDSYKETERQARKLGLVLPLAFVKLYTHEDLITHLPFRTHSSWLTGDQVLKCPSRVGGLHHDGYLIPFYQEEGQFYLSLYLERAGWHCVVLSTVKPRSCRANLGILDEDFVPEPASPSMVTGEEPPDQSAQRCARADRTSRDSHASLTNPSEESIRQREQYFTAAHRLAKWNICSLSEVDAAAQEGLQLGLDLLFHGPMIIVGLTFEEFLASFYFEHQLSLYFSHLLRSPSDSLRDYVAHRYLPVCHDTDVQSISNLTSSMGDVYS